MFKGSGKASRIMSKKGKAVLNVVKFGAIVAVILVGYSFSSVISERIFNRSPNRLDRSTQGEDLTAISPTDLIREELTLDFSSIMENLLDSSLLDSMTDEEKTQFFEDLFGDGIEEFMDDEDLTPDEFLQQYGDDLQDLMESIGGQEFSADALDQFPPELALILLAKDVFYAYESNPSSNSWDDPEDTLFKTGAYDEYNLDSFSWKISDLLDNRADILDIDEVNDYKWKIKYPITTLESTTPAMPTISPSPRIQLDSWESTPIIPSNDPAPMKMQSNMGSAYMELEYSLTDLNKQTNITYDLLYNGGDYHSPSYYDNDISMSQYVGTSITVAACSTSPKQGETSITWTDYRNTHPNFDQVVSDLASYAEFTAASNIYEKMEAIVNFVGANFVYDPASGFRPDENEDPLEWFCEGKQSAMSFEFTYLTVSLARLNNIAAKYVSGYKYNPLFEFQYGGAYSDPSEGGDVAYPYRVGNLYSWVEAFIPTSTTTGDWVSFDNRFDAEPIIPTPDGVRLNLDFGGAATSDLAGVPRFISDFPLVGNVIPVELTYTMQGSAIQNQKITVSDTTYGEVIGDFYTGQGGIGTYEIELENLVPGTHVLNFTTTYLGLSFGNVSVINVLDDVEVYSTLSDEYIVAPSNQDQNIDIDGYVWDPVLGKPIKSAQVSFTGLMQPTESQPTEEVFNLSPNITTTVENGNDYNFTLAALIPGFPVEDYGREYKIVTNFDGKFDLSAEILQYALPYQLIFADIFGGGEQICTFDPNANLSLTVNNTVEIYDDEYHRYTFYINNSYSVNNTVGTYPTGPTIGERDGSFSLYINATTVLGTGGEPGQTINIYDETESDRLVTSFITDGTGFGEISHDIAAEAVINPEFWTAGPHLLRIEWDERALTCYSKIWIMVQAPIFINQTTEYFVDGQGGISNNRYLIDSGSPADADDLILQGTIQDNITGEFIHGAQIYYQLFDKSWNLLPSTSLTTGNTEEIVGAAEDFYSESFYFSGLLDTNLAPIRTNINFSGEWAGLGDNWNILWNSLWGSYFGGFNLNNDTSDGIILLADPTDYGISGFVNSTNFNDYDDGQVNKYSTVVILGDTLNISSRILTDGIPLPDAVVTLTDNSTFPLQTLTTGSDGWANFSLLIFNNSIDPGDHEFTLTITFTNGSFTYVNTSILVVEFNPLIGFNFAELLNGADFTSYPGQIYPQVVSIGDNINFTGNVTYTKNSIIQQIANANISIYDNGVLLYSIISDGTGVYNKQIIFNNTFTEGTHIFNLSVEYNGGSFIFYDSALMNVTFDPALNYGTNFLVEGINIESLSANNYPVIQLLGDYLDLSTYFFYNDPSSPLSGASITITDSVAGVIDTGSTDASGYYNFSVFYDSSVAIDLHTYTISLSFSNVSFSIANISMVIVDYQPANGYVFIPRINEVPFDSWNRYDPLNIQGPQDILKVSCALYYNYSGTLVGVSGVSVSLTQAGANGTTIIPGATDGNGYFNFSLQFLKPDAANGSYSFEFDISITNGTYSTSFNNLSYVEYDESLLHLFLVYFNDVPLADIGGTYGDIQHAGDVVNISVQFLYDEGSGLVGQDGVTVTFNIPTNGSFIPQNYITDSNGWVNFSVLFDGSFAVASHNFKLSMDNSSAEYAYQIVEEGICTFVLNPEDDYTFAPLIEANPFANYAPLYNFDAVQAIGDTVTISGTLVNSSTNIQGATVTLSNSSGPMFSTNTDLSGAFSFTVEFNNSMAIGLQTFTVAITYIDYYGFTIDFSSNIRIDFDPELGYTLVGKVEGSAIADGNPYVTPQEVSDQLTITAEYHFFGSGVANVLVTLSNSSGPMYTSLTNGAGVATFTIEFNNTINPGIQTYTLSLTILNGTCSVSNTTSFTINYDPLLSYDLVARIDGAPYSNPVPSKNINDTVIFSYQLMFDIGVPTGVNTATVRLYVDGGLFGTNNTGVGGIYTIPYTFVDTTTTGTQTFRLELSFTNGTIIIDDFEANTIYFDPLGGMTYSPLVDGGNDFSTTITKTTGQSVIFTYQIQNNGVAVSGVTVSLDGGPSGSTLTADTNGAGIATFTIAFTTAINPGPYYFTISFSHTFGIHPAVGTTESVWVVYEDALTITYTNPGTIEFTTANDASGFSLNGLMEASSNRPLVNGGLLIVTINNPSATDVTDQFTIIGLDSYNPLDGSFSISVDQLVSATLDVGNYSLIISYSGDLTTGPGGYSYSSNPSSSAFVFGVFDNPVISSSWTHNLDLPYFLPNVAGTWSQINITGELNYSNSSNVNIDGLAIEISIYSNNGLVETITVYTDVFGNFELLDYGVTENYLYYTIDFAGSTDDFLYPVEETTNFTFV
ncbi:hypothetical protein NEF87_004456 [Candidatus Lokiarchaeum ossiferum]|uniref:Transglutaminase-like domain-containing protein n=1 Tax=Candidatus Lokiarchaeum ossiferum TaxID=2951803 RepID=A0ABY6HXS8_9ARCH|nr:hypothetical protein NEF87_004456 [Candidatus Lokiarchaeum sp. B-35]